ncbi:MAG TPA: alanine--tRNA ligase-related protein, partial [Candidatus Saccharimonadales bacterium]|nr:alanine--tRNA ligase-related protein [Candidatus Saccharimonadales bacterium]
MTAQEIREKYLDFFVMKNHKLIPRANLVPQDDPTTLFTGSGMQPLIPYLLGQPHPEGSRLVDSQTCFRAEDMDEVGDNRHTTFFEMLGNWSLGDYFKEEQIPWFWEFLTGAVRLDPNNLYATCFIGDGANGIDKDTESAEIYKRLFREAGIEAKEVELPSNAGAEKGMQDGRIFYYDASKNWWSREGGPANMAEGEPGGPDSEIFYDFGTPHDPKYGQNCHPNCDCGRFLEIGNSVFMTYKKTAGGFEKLPKPNVDFGGGLERIAAASNNNPDVFRVSLLEPIINGLESLSGKKYEEHQASMRVIADHL